MPSDRFEHKGFTYRISNDGRYFRGRQYAVGFVEDEISERKFKAAYKSYYGKGFISESTKASRKTFALESRWKRELWSTKAIKGSPWNNENRQLHSRYKALTIDNKNPYFGRVEYAKDHKTGKKDLWGAIRGRKDLNGGAFVLNGTKEWIRHLQIARHQMRVQAENFRVVVGQKALKIFQLSFKYHKFYNEDTNWPKLAPYTQRKRKVLGTWFGEQRSKLFETGALTGSLSNEVIDGKKKVLVSTVTTGNPKTQRTKISVMDVIRGVRVSGRPKFTTDYIYAGIHNEGVPKGSKPGAVIPQRQFMGWSRGKSGNMDKVDKFAYSIIDRYLFDSVFMAKKR